MIPAHDILDALAHGRRRNVCEVVAAAEREFLPLEEVSERVASRDHDGADPQTVRVELHHVHLPKLDDAGLLEYDHELNTVRYESDPVVESIADGAEPLEAARALTDAE
ncbi:ArsR family transcriptional regulator [Natronoarchaeum mannanilyticum]|uniref:DUF7344 domain-containing protein n=1 Tax=Natronoarchaeum mannanilyticum TaxID=926360 RepID=A0AAV3T9L0_9EURY